MKLVGLLAVCSVLVAQDVPRPRITGVSHMALFVSDIENSRGFYKDFLGYDESEGAVFQINPRQFVKLLPEREAGSDRLVHIALETDDLEGMRRYLHSKGIAFQGNRVKDPDGHEVEFLQQKASTAPLGTRRISDTMMHVGIIVNSLEPAMKLYRDVLGFEETWRGSSNGQVLSWVNLKVPNGTDYIEFMLHDPVPPPGKRGSAHHICLQVPDIEKAAATLKDRSANYTRPIEIRTGRNRKRQLNVFDPDGTRTELMEPNTIDGQPAPSSTAPPPK